MGWLYTLGATRADVISERIKGYTWARGSMQTIKHCTRGNVLWMVQEVYRRDTGHFERFLECDLLQNSRGYGWGYKDMDESMGPYYYSCPLSYLDGTRVLNPGWRKAVREYHARRNRKIKVGECYELLNSTIKMVRIVSSKPLIGRDTRGCSWRVSKVNLGAKIPGPPGEKPEWKVRCKFCGNLVPKDTAHRHAGSWVAVWEAFCALGVMVTDERIRAYLEKHDPKALQQALEALRNLYTVFPSIRRIRDCPVSIRDKHFTSPME